MIEAARLLEKYAAPVPRYTSYPTAPHFVDGAGPALWQDMLDGIRETDPVSVYVHVPFCDRLCWFCGCHTKHVRQYEPVKAYMASLGKEIELVGSGMAARARLEHLHLGGGSPSLLHRQELAQLRSLLEAAFHIDKDSEISVEIDPSDMAGDTFEGLRDLGLTRASIGVQDFDPLVQRAINRPQTFEQTREVVGELRHIGVGSLNIDALYGLPHQTMMRLAATIDKVVELQPDRVALFGYAHVPWMKKHQRLIDEASLPGSLERFEQAEMAAERLVAGGYQRVGFDHFALPADSLAKAASAGRLHRNFQGYTTDACETLIPLGASSIGQFAGGFVQNNPATGLYRAAVEAGRTAASRGLALTRDDVIRGWMIERLMCDFAIDLAALADKFGDAAAPYVDEARAVAKAEQDGLCHLAGDRLEIPEPARPFVRIVAARFDAYFGNTAFRYSKAV